MLIEPGRDEKLREPIQGPLEIVRRDVEEIVGILQHRVGVVGTAVCIDISLVFSRFGVFFGSQEQHVLQVMRQPLPVDGIVAAARIDIQRCGGTLRARVGDQHDRQSVVQADGAIQSII